MDSTAILDILTRAVPGARGEPVPAIDQPTLLVPRQHLIETCQALRDHPDLEFSFLAELTAVDYWPREPRFELVYLLACLGVPGFPTPRSARAPQRLRLKVRVAGDDARVPTVMGVWPAANWLEREVWDLFGICFDGHPDLRRLLLPDDWEGHPLRKDFPVQVDLTPKAAEPLQLSAEQFAANIEAARRASRRREDE